MEKTIVSTVCRASYECVLHLEQDVLANIEDFH